MGAGVSAVPAPRARRGGSRAGGLPLCRSVWSGGGGRRQGAARDGRGGTVCISSRVAYPSAAAGVSQRLPAVSLRRRERRGRRRLPGRGEDVVGYAGRKNKKLRSAVAGAAVRLARQAGGRRAPRREEVKAGGSGGDDGRCSPPPRGVSAREPGGLFLAGLGGGIYRRLLPSPPPWTARPSAPPSWILIRHFFSSPHSELFFIIIAAFFSPLLSFPPSSAPPSLCLRSLPPSFFPYAPFPLMIHFPPVAAGAAPVAVRDPARRAAGRWVCVCVCVLGGGGGVRLPWALWAGCTRAWEAPGAACQRAVRRGRRGPCPSAGGGGGGAVRSRPRVMPRGPGAAPRRGPAEAAACGAGGAPPPPRAGRGQLSAALTDGPRRSRAVEGGGGPAAARRRGVGGDVCRRWRLPAAAGGRGRWRPRRGWGWTVAAAGGQP